MLTKAVTFSEKRTKRTMRQVIAGLCRVHRLNIMHRDMKVEECSD